MVANGMYWTPDDQASVLLRSLRMNSIPLGENLGCLNRSNLR